MSIAAYPKPGPKQVGRPKGSGRIKKPEEKSTHPAKLSPELIELVKQERRHNESFSDTIVRMIVEKNTRIARLIKKVDALEERLRPMKSQFIIQRGP